MRKYTTRQTEIHTLGFNEGMAKGKKQYDIYSLMLNRLLFFLGFWTLLWLGFAIGWNVK